jgi:hypothetical protein
LKINRQTLVNGKWLGNSQKELHSNRKSIVQKKEDYHFKLQGKEYFSTLEFIENLSKTENKDVNF